MLPLVGRLMSAFMAVQATRATLATLEEGENEAGEGEDSGASAELPPAELAAAKQCAANLLRANTVAEEIAPSGTHSTLLQLTSSARSVVCSQTCLVEGGFSMTGDDNCFRNSRWRAMEVWHGCFRELSVHRRSTMKIK